MFLISFTGFPDNKIRFVPAEQVDQIQPNRTIRLVDGPSINEGVVQVKSLVVLILKESSYYYKTDKLIST